jgi:thymidylate synthase (FAD)
MPEPETEVQNGLAWLLFVESARSIYANLVADLEDPTISDKTARRKQAREAARSVLPNCTETKIVVTGNCRAWRHFLEMRGSTHADAEIRRLALAVLPVLNIESPAIFGDYVVETTDGVDHITTPYRKV